MNNLKLMVKFQLAGSGDVQIKCASRMKIDGGGAVLLFDANDRVERLDMGVMESFSVQSLQTHQTSFAA
jgi:hypothetical protein